jgi:fluoroacetyl-CoA thioesterase
VACFDLKHGTGRLSIGATRHSYYLASIRASAIGSRPWNVAFSIRRDRKTGRMFEMRQIPLGTKGRFTLRVLPEHLANRFKDAMLPQVLATPVMVLMMENAALNAIRSYLDPDESAVGTAIDIRHLAATPLGHEVSAEAEVTKVEGTRIEFKVSAHDEIEEIGSGTHRRTVINLATFNKRLAAKSKTGA